MHWDIFLKKWKYNMLSVELLKDIKYLSVDIFDTLLIRECTETILLERTYQLISQSVNVELCTKEFAKYRQKAEVHARLYLSKDEVSLTEIYDQLPISENDKVVLLKSELIQHSKALILNQNLLKQLKEAVSAGIDLVLISDMYLSQAQITCLLIEHDLWLGSLPLYVSSEWNQTKRIGDLFITVGADRNWKVKEWLHIGDDPIADVVKPQELGINAQQLKFYPEYKALLDLEQRGLSLESEIEGARKLASLHNQNHYFHLGSMVFGPVLSAFADWTIKKAKAVNASTILCISREGICFSKVIEQRLKQQNISDVKVKVFYASRQSTLLPSVDLNQADWLSMLLDKVLELCNISVKHFCDILTLDRPEQLREYDNELSNNWSELSVSGVSLLTFILNFITKNENKVVERIVQQQQAFYEYCQLFSDVDDSITVDFGGGGTIQAQLLHFFKAKANLLFYQTSRVYRYTDKLLFSSFISEQKGDKGLVDIILDNYFILEALFNGWRGSVLEYDAQSSQPKLGLGIPQNKTALMPFYAGLEAFNDALQQLNKKSDLLVAKQILHRFLQTPLSFEVRLFCELYHQSILGNEQAVPVMQRTREHDSTQQEFYCWRQGRESLNTEQILPVDAELRKILNQLQHREHRQVSVYCAGQFFEKLLPHLQQLNIEVEHLVDRKAELVAYAVQGYQVQTLKCALQGGASVFVIASGTFIDVIKQKIKMTNSALLQPNKLEIVCA
jgi:hypothetical protein